MVGLVVLATILLQAAPFHKVWGLPVHVGVIMVEMGVPQLLDIFQICLEQVEEHVSRIPPILAQWALLELEEMGLDIGKSVGGPLYHRLLQPEILRLHGMPQALLLYMVAAVVVAPKVSM